MRSKNRWIRWQSAKSNGRTTKIPKQVNGRNAKVNDPATWSTFSAAESSTVGSGLGFVLNGDGIAVIDLDHCLEGGKPTAAAQRVLDLFPGAWVEASPSGTGLHIWGTAPSAPGRKTTTIDGLHLEFYTRDRYMTITGDTYRPGGLDTPLYVAT